MEAIASSNIFVNRTNIILNRLSIIRLRDKADYAISRLRTHCAFVLIRCATRKNRRSILPSLEVVHRPNINLRFGCSSLPILDKSIFSSNSDKTGERHVSRCYHETVMYVPEIKYNRTLYILLYFLIIIFILFYYMSAL